MSLPAHLFRSVSRRSVLSGGPRTFSHTPTLLVRPQNPTFKTDRPSTTAAPAAATETPRDPPSSSTLDPSTAPTPPSLEPFVEPGKATPPPTATFAEGASTTTPQPTATAPSSTPAAETQAAPAAHPSAEEVIPERPDLSMLPSLDVDPSALPEPAEEGEAGKPTGAKSSKQQGGFNTFDKVFLGSLGFGLIGGGWYLGRPLTDEERVKLNLKPEDAEPSLKDRAMSRTFSNYYVQYLTEPAWTELLPPPIPPIRPYTLLVDLEGILTCSKWDREHGWRTAKRPGADYFIAYLSQFYEIVLFTHQPSMNAVPIAEKLDPYAAYMPYRLYRDATRLDFSAGGGGVTVKDLKYLNRDLSKVIMLDTNPDHALAQPDNALIIPKWTGDGGEAGLVELIPFLESVGIYQPKDVRPILKAYHGKDVAVEYNKVEAQRRELEYNTWAATPAGKRAIAKGEAGSSGSSWSLSSLFGGQPPAPSTLKQDKPAPPPSYLDVKRGQAQAMYLQEQKYWKENEAEIKKMMDEDRERQLKEMGGGTVLGMLGALSGAGQSPKPEEQAK